MSCNAYDNERGICMMTDMPCHYINKFEDCNDYIPPNENGVRLHEIFGFELELNDKYYFKMIRAYCSGKSVDVIIKEMFPEANPDLMARICAFVAFQNTLFEQRSRLEALKFGISQLVKYNLMEFKNGDKNSL